jgi:hypothetical protein
MRVSYHGRLRGAGVDIAFGSEPKAKNFSIETFGMEDSFGDSRIELPSTLLRSLGWWMIAAADEWDNEHT